MKSSKLESAFATGPAAEAKIHHSGQHEHVAPLVLRLVVFSQLLVRISIVKRMLEIDDDWTLPPNFLSRTCTGVPCAAGVQ
jgi:hypothetical protein